MTVLDNKLLGRNIPATFAAFVVCVACAQQVRPIRPRRRRRTSLRRLWHEFHLENALASFTNCFTHAVVTRIATANDQDFFALGIVLFWIFAIRHFGTVQVIESEVNAFGFTARDFQVTSVRRTNSEERVIEIAVDVFSRNILADFGIANKLDASGFEESYAAVNHLLFELPVRNAVTQESTRLFVLFVNRHGKAFATERFGSKQARRTSANHGCGLSVRFSRREAHPAFFEGGFDHELFDLTDHHSIVIQVTCAARFAKSRTNTSREFREECRLANDIVPLADIACGNRFVKFRNEVSKRATCAVAERHAAI